jgi:hypothetical protein
MSASQPGFAGWTMITIDDCIGFSGLTREEVDAVGEHEHVPEAAAAALSNYLLNSLGGAECIRQMIVEDIRAALDAGRIEHAAELFAALRRFLDDHPEARAGTRPD